MVKFSLILTTLCMWAIGIIPSGHAAEPFHAGGVGPCDGCHTMHNSRDGVPGGGISSRLLQGADPSSICLNCHAGPGGPDRSSVFSDDGSAMTPGGDFYWLTKDYAWATGSSPGSSHGHNVIARDFGLVQDPVLAQAPGGTYQARALGCISCHDPHGTVKGGTKSGRLPVSDSGSYGYVAQAGTTLGNYRLLGDSHYDGGKTASGFAFSNDAPVARQNGLNKYGETDWSHVDYGAGMSEWCGNCHNGILNSEHRVGGGGFEHPAGNSENLESEMISNYNSYIRTGDLSGSAATAYLQFVPFERGRSDPAFLDPSSNSGPDASSNVMCLTCHRAHASAFRAAGRWDFDAPLLVDSHPQAGDVGVFGSDVLYSYYGRSISTEFGPTQGPFCEKCHGLNVP
jgi:hypothetical protein